jgi:hypothetical protein
MLVLFAQERIDEGHTIKGRACMLNQARVPKLYTDTAYVAITDHQYECLAVPWHCMAFLDRLTSISGIYQALTYSDAQQSAMFVGATCHEWSSA